MKLSLNISPCPNDTFMFDALVNGHIDTGGLSFDVDYFDIEQLNRKALDGTACITKISCAVLPLVQPNYVLLDSGSALGRGNGPLLVGRTSDIPDAAGLVAVPGIHTTANLLMNRLFPEVTNKKPVLFSEIADGVARGDYDAGVLIHEGRFTYKEKGLRLIADLGSRWEERTGLPLPLGCIVAPASLPEHVVALFGRLLRESIAYAVDNPEVSRDFVKSHAQAMDDAVIDSHIALFVNEYSLSLGDTGREAIRALTTDKPL